MSVLKKKCPVCKKSKLLSGFWKHKNRKDGVQSICKTCHLEYNRRKDKGKARTAARKYSRSEKGKQRIKNYQLSYYYNISLAEYDQMFHDQNGVCAICGNPEINRRLAVDHCHKTSKVRGLLCTTCNVKLGWFVDLETEILKYL